ncbi:hypothetical protein BJ508DRAFT_91739 [Ascobolus immersus RN42]|uniref:Uncharacterized protein n=1 Tax=Ascobolus immersus RN42 TaxID=1160509 RepID=A0A3N4HPA0_ASCIM|nr:hypothetical protein BJ508DRAFT_91739 [Ascobolus immersus RN42]
MVLQHTHGWVQRHLSSSPSIKLLFVQYAQTLLNHQPKHWAYIITTFRGLVFDGDEILHTFVGNQALLNAISEPGQKLITTLERDNSEIRIYLEKCAERLWWWCVEMGSVILPCKWRPEGRTVFAEGLGHLLNSFWWKLLQLQPEFRGTLRELFDIGGLIDEVWAEKKKKESFAGIPGVQTISVPEPVAATTTTNEPCTPPGSPPLSSSSPLSSSPPPPPPPPPPPSSASASSSSPSPPPSPPPEAPPLPLPEKEAGELSLAEIEAEVFAVFDELEAATCPCKLCQTMYLLDIEMEEEKLKRMHEGNPMTEEEAKEKEFLDEMVAVIFKEKIAFARGECVGENDDAGW